MQKMRHDLTNIEQWRLRLGLYPVPMFSDESLNTNFVLFNGNRGNFCLDLTNEKLGSESRNRAWSSNVGHYVALIDGTFEVQRWDNAGNSVERYLFDEVNANLEKFHARLERDEPSRELSVVAHVIRVFRSLRSTVSPEVNGPASLKAFLYLLACVTDNLPRNEIVLEKWALDPSAAEVANDIPHHEWRSLLDELIHGRAMDGLTPNPTLLLRHASGQVFQEAHYEAVAISQDQLMLEGFVRSPVKLTRERKSRGLHFTPPALARTLVEESLAVIDMPTEITIFDPSCGSGEFLREALRQLKLRNYKGKITLIGWDISQAACDMARFVLSWERRGRESTVVVNIECTDSINIGTWPERVTLIIMNPPFVSWQDMSGQQKDSVGRVLGTLTTRRPDLSSAFVWKAASTLLPGAVLASILPASFLDGDSSERIRGQLSEIVDPKLLARLGSHQLFSSAIVDAGFLVAQRIKGDPISRNNYWNIAPTAFWADHRPHSTTAGLRALRMLRNNPRETAYPVVKDGFSIYRNPSIGRGETSWAPRPFQSWRLLNELQSIPRVKTLFEVKQGVRTGDNKVFILSKDQWQTLTKNERTYFQPALLNESIRKGALIHTAYVFYPYGSKAIATEEQLRQAVASYYDAFLLPNKDSLRSRAKIDPSRWWELTWHRNWLEERKPKIVSTYFGDAGSFAWDFDGRFVVVQGYGWLHRPTQAVEELPENVGFALSTNARMPVF